MHEPRGREPLATALLIDDDTALLETYRRAIESHGLSVETAASWDEGLTLFHVLSPDLVIADYNLPGSKMGLRLLAEIRRLRPTVRLVLLSGAVNKSDLESAARLGIADRVLTKGNSEAALAAVIEEIAESSSTGRNETDWVAFASAAVAAKGIDLSALDRLDDLLQRKVTGE